jgi:hypothetical protein
MPFKMVVFFAKRAFPPTWRVLEMWEASLENAKQPSSASAAFEASGCRCPVFPRTRPRMCRREVWVAALKLIEAHSHTPSRFLDGSNFRAPLSPRCTALSVASCGNRGAAPNFGTRVPGNLGGEGTFKKRYFPLFTNFLSNSLKSCSVEKFSQFNR